jgi:hypothetical protein
LCYDAANERSSHDESLLNASFNFLERLCTNRSSVCNRAVRIVAMTAMIWKLPNGRITRFPDAISRWIVAIHDLHIPVNAANDSDYLAVLAGIRYEDEDVARD